LNSLKFGYKGLVHCLRQPFLFGAPGRAHSLGGENPHVQECGYNVQEGRGRRRPVQAIADLFLLQFLRWCSK
jgi:hypothetical protein